MEIIDVNSVEDILPFDHREGFDETMSLKVCEDKPLARTWSK